MNTATHHFDKKLQERAMENLKCVRKQIATRGVKISKADIKKSN